MKSERISPFWVNGYQPFSAARGEQTEDSDVDVCVDLEVPSIFSLVHIKEELKQLFGCEVDVVRIRQNMDALLKKDIIEEGIYV